MSVHASIEPLHWESEFFQRASARLHFGADAAPLTLKALQCFSLVQAKVPAQRQDLVDALAGYQFQLVEGEVDLSLAVAEQAPEVESQTRVATTDDIPSVRTAAGQVFAMSRFRAPWYAADASSRFYALWAEKAIYGTFDHQCLLTEDATGQPSGLVTLRALGAGEARIGLLAAWPGAAGQGVGKQLMVAAIQWCRQRDITRLRVATQFSNAAALRLYIRCGALVESTAYWLYRG